MSSSDRPVPHRSVSRRSLVALLAVSALALPACTVRPLYGDAGLAAGTAASGETMKTALGSISIKPARNRVEQEVRNQLIFLLRGDGSEPATPKYTLEQTVTVVNTSTAIIQQAKEREPTSASVMVRSSYRLVDAATGTILATGRRSVSASYDVPRQSYAALRARRDAENRAARELAELMRIALAQNLEKLPPSS